MGLDPSEGGSTASHAQDRGRKSRIPGEQELYKTFKYHGRYNWEAHTKLGSQVGDKYFARKLLSLDTYTWVWVLMSFFADSLRDTVSSILLCFTANKIAAQSTETTRYESVAQSYPMQRDQRSNSREKTHNGNDGPSTNPQSRGSMDREELTDSLHQTLGTRKKPHTSAPCEGLERCDFIYDVMLLTLQNSLVRRRMVVDFETDINIMSETVHKRLNLRMKNFTGDAISWWNRATIEPLGKVKASWKICGRKRTYSAEFHVVQGAEFDLLLGRTSVRQLGLYRADPVVATRLRSLN